MLAQDLRYALRTMGRQRAFTAVAVLTLAIALGANTAIFSVVNAILLRPLPYTNPDRMVELEGFNRVTGDDFRVLSYPNYVDVRAQTKTLEHVAAFTRSGAFLMEGSEPEMLTGINATANLFPMLGVRPQLGRFYNQAEDRSGGPRVMVISDELWKRRFGSDPRVIGRSVRFGTAGNQRTIIGVLPVGFRFPAGDEPRDYFAPFEDMGVGPQERESRGSIYISVVGKLREGISIPQANAELDTIGKRLEKQYADTNTGLTFRSHSMHELIVRDVRPAVLLLFGAVGLVLLIGCANVANLLLARAAARYKEISIRAALGATRGRIIVQLLVESVVISALAGALGLLLAAWGIDALLAIAPADIPRLDAISLDRDVLIFNAVLSILTGIIFGLAPALSASKTDLNEALKDATRGSTVSRKRNRTRSALVVTAVALSLVLLAGAGLLLRSFINLTDIDPGYDYTNAVEIRLAPRALAYPEQPQIRIFYDRLLATLRAVPGVQGVGAATMLPLSPNESYSSFDVQGRPLPAPGSEPSAKYVQVTPGFFAAARIPLLQGRDITPNDIDSAPNVLVVNQSFAREFFPNENAVGKRLVLDRETNDVAEIVGVVRDVRWSDVATDPPSTMFFPFAQADRTRTMSVLVRAPNAAALGPTLRAAIRTVDREQPIVSMETLETTRSESLEARRFNLILLALLAVIALILAGVGIYSVMSYTVTQRTSEIGIRMALGAQAGDVFRMVVGHAVKLVAIGLGAGLAFALVASRVMRSLLYGVTPTDPWTYVAICGVIGTIALIASYIPANRATKVDPLVAIRYD